MIVNRDNPWAVADLYGPTGGPSAALYASPTVCPQLASTVRGDWRSATSLRAYFLGDLWGSRAQSRRLGALERILFYYPQLGKRQVNRLVRRPFVAWPLADKCAQSILDAPTIPGARAALRAFRAKNPKAQTQFVADLIVANAFTKSNGKPRKWQKRAPVILMKLFRTYKANRPVACWVNELQDAKQLVLTLHEFPYPWIPAEIARLFHHCIESPVPSEDVVSMDEFAISCYLGLFGTRLNEAPKRYLLARIAHLTKAGASEADRLTADFLEAGLARKLLRGEF